MGTKTFFILGGIHIDPATIAKIAQYAIMILKDEETRNKILMTTISMVVLLVFLFVLPFYLITHPLEAFAMYLDDGFMTLISDFQNSYGFYGDGAVIDISGG